MKKGILTNKIISMIIFYYVPNNAQKHAKNILLSKLGKNISLLESLSNSSPKIKIDDGWSGYRGNFLL